jgi:FixJ family two-component response regulator
MNAAAEPLVYVVDDDEAFRDSVAWLIESAGLGVKTFASAQQFLGGYLPEQHACVVLDIRMPDMSGMELQEELNRRSHAPPIIFVTGHGDVPMAVTAVKRGAVDFIEKPFSDSAFLELVQKALQLDAELRTPREREVMERVIAGKLNKVIADDLGISIKTVEAHRARVMEKLGVSSLAELVQFSLGA